VSALRVTTWVDGKRVPSRGIGTVVTFSGRATRGRPLDWAVTWTL
jgi:hypothetical protein